MGFDVEGHDLSMGEKKKDGRSYYPERHAGLPFIASSFETRAKARSSG
jgi:hypothetical protein